MPSSQSHFQPPPPIRTNTSGSQKSESSEAMSPALTSTFSRGERSVASLTEESFFGAIAARVRRARSRSRSRNPASRTRSKSPYQMPPEHFPPTSAAHPTSPTSPTYATPRPQQPRHSSSASQSSRVSTATPPQRPSLQGPTRRSTSSSDAWRGRHSNSWLFNDFSVTDTAKDLFHLSRKS